MAINERINFFRNLHGMTLKYLGLKIGFPDSSADVRMAQYENGARTPKADVIIALAGALGVAPEALNVPDIDSYLGIMHTFFALEDLYGLTVSESDEDLCLRFDSEKGKSSAELTEMFKLWREQKAKLAVGDIDKETYDAWRYQYPKFDSTKSWSKVPSKDFSDTMVEAFKDKLGLDK